MPDRTGPPLRTYLLGVLLVVALVEASLGWLAWRSAVSDARQQGRTEAETVATLARTELQRSFVLIRAEVETAAEDDRIMAAARAERGPCGLRRSRLSAFPVGHVSVLGRTGDIICSTMPDAVTSVSTYRFQRWLSQARRTTEAVPSGPYADPFLQEQAVAIVSSIRDGGQLLGFVVQVNPLDGLTAELRDRASTRSRAVVALLRVDTNQTLSYVGMDEPDPDQTPPETPSIEPQAWSSAADRIWAGADMPDHGWRIYVGIREEVALGDVWAAARGHGLAAAVSLLLALVLLLAIERRISDPLRRMTAAVGTAAIGDTHSVEPDRSGPREIHDLAATISGFLADREVQDQELRRLAFVDPQTGLSNLTRLRERLSAELGSFQEGRLAALMILGSDPASVATLPAPEDDSRVLALAEALAARVPPRVSIYRAGPAELALLATDVGDRSEIDELQELIAQDEHAGEVRIGVEILEDGSRDADEVIVSAAAALDRARALSVRSYISGSSDAA